MGTAVVISPLVKADIPAILGIEHQSQLEPWSERSFLEELERLHSYLFVARLAEQDSEESATPHPRYDIVGYICYWCVADELQILNIAVRADCRRRGIAGKLLAHAIGMGCDKKARSVVLEVRRSNDAARRLYETFGFRVVGERPDYYGVQREPAILMELEIFPNEA